MLSITRCARWSCRRRFGGRSRAAHEARSLPAPRRQGLCLSRGRAACHVLHVNPSAEPSLRADGLRPRLKAHVMRQLRPPLQLSFARAMRRSALALHACASALAGAVVARRLPRAACAPKPGAVVVCEAGGSRRAWRSLNALHPSAPAFPRSRASVGMRTFGSFNPGSHNQSVERTHNGGRGLRAASAWSAPSRSAHVQRYASAQSTFAVEPGSRHAP